MRTWVNDVLMLSATFLLVYGGILYFALFGFEQDKTGGVARIALSAAIIAIVKKEHP